MINFVKTTISMSWLLKGSILPVDISSLPNRLSLRYCIPFKTLLISSSLLFTPIENPSCYRRSFHHHRKDTSWTCLRGRNSEAKQEVGQCHSSVDSSVMEAERRVLVIRFWILKQLVKDDEFIVWNRIENGTYYQRDSEGSVTQGKI